MLAQLTSMFMEMQTFKDTTMGAILYSVWLKMGIFAGNIIQSVDVTDGKALGSALIANFAAAAWGDLLFQILVGLGTAVIMLLTIWEKWQKIRRENRQWKKDIAEDDNEAER